MFKEERVFRVPNPSLVRKGKTINMEGITLERIVKAQEKGFTVEQPVSWNKGGKMKAQVNRVIVEGDK